MADIWTLTAHTLDGDPVIEQSENHPPTVVDSFSLNRWLHVEKVGENRWEVRVADEILLIEEDQDGNVRRLA